MSAVVAVTCERAFYNYNHVFFFLYLLTIGIRRYLKHAGERSRPVGPSQQLEKVFPFRTRRFLHSGFLVLSMNVCMYVCAN